MKTAISLPDELFAHTDRWVSILGVTRSALVADALREHLARLEARSLTTEIDAALELLRTGDDDTREAVAASRRRLARDTEDW